MRLEDCQLLYRMRGFESPDPHPEGGERVKDEVLVNGVKLTRAQVEGALKELNAPPPPLPTFKTGQVVSCGRGNHLNVVVTRAALATLNRLAENAQNLYLLVRLHDGAVASIQTPDMWVVREVTPD